MTLQELKKQAIQKGLEAFIKNDELHVSGNDLLMIEFKYSVVSWSGNGTAEYIGSYPKWSHGDYTGSPIVYRFILS